jgi:hypothetical protein
MQDRPDIRQQDACGPADISGQVGNTISIQWIIHIVVMPTKLAWFGLRVSAKGNINVAMRLAIIFKIGE